MMSKGKYFSKKKKKDINEDKSYEASQCIRNMKKCKETRRKNDQDKAKWKKAELIHSESHIKSQKYQKSC